MRVAIGILVILLLAPSVSAQLPGIPTTCGPITIPNAPAVPTALGLGERGDIVVEVANGGRLPASVNVSARVATTGWTIVSSPQLSTVAAQSSGTFFFTVEATSATTDGSFDFAATGSCTTPLGATCPGGACDAGNANTAASITFQPAEGFRIPGLDDLSPELIIAALVLVGLASVIPFALRRKKNGIAADCPEPLKMVKPGRGTSFPIELRNPGREAAVAHFEVGAVPEGWSAFMPLPEVQLAGREARSLWLMVRSPATAGNGEAIDVELRLTDGRGKDGRVVKVRAEVHGAEGAA